jgi:hypothetical protein
MNSSTMATRSTQDGIWARGLNAALGIWLIISAYLWPHATGQITNAWIVGLLAIAFAAVAAYSAPQARYANTVLGIWLFISAWAVVTMSVATVWNNVIVGALMFVFSLVPNQSRGAGHSMRAVT